MKNTLLILFFFLFALVTYSQESFYPIKDNNTKFIIDGIISDDEWNNAIEVDLDYEVNPGNNISPKEKQKYLSSILILIYILDLKHMQIQKKLEHLLDQGMTLE